MMLPESITALFARRAAFHRERQGNEDALEPGCYNRWEVSEMLAREIEAVAEECVAILRSESNTP